MSHSIEFLRDKLARVRREHTWPKGTRIESVEYGEVHSSWGTQIYVNGALGCVVTSRHGNVEYIVWSDELSGRKWGDARVPERWERGVFKEMGAPVEYGADEWRRMWTRDDKWYEYATEFYLEAEPVEPVVETVDPLPGWREQRQRNACEKNCKRSSITS